MRLSFRRVAILATSFIVILFSTGLTINYPTPQSLIDQFEQLAKANSSIARTHVLSTSPGGSDVLLLELSTNAANPAILVVANMEGNAPIGSLAALRLAERLAGDWKDDLNNYSFFIVPVGNPDGYEHFFDKPTVERFTNAAPFNDDKDDATDEDGPEDLNGDGFITIMRQSHPQGKWMTVKSNLLLMKKADGAKGESGQYRLFEEGIDNDGDGEINEDGPGGSNPGHNFPHRFKHYTNTDGRWAASEIESRAILEFCFDHPEIIMAITLGRSNTLTEPPPNDQRSEAGGGHYPLPSWWARQAGIDPGQKFPIAEIVDMAKSFFGDPSIDEDGVMRFLEAGATVNPDRRDLPYFKEISKQFNDFLKENELEEKRLASAKLSEGCFEEWAYYQFGVPSFAWDFWNLPEPKKEKDEADSTIGAEQIKEMTSEELLELGEEKLTALLKDNSAPDQFTVERLMEGLKSGRMTPERLSKMIERFAKADKDDEGGDETEEALLAFDPDAFVSWTPFDHPTLGKVEIGGVKPWASLAPSADTASVLIDKQLPFIRKLVGMTPRLEIKETKTTEIEPGVYRVEVWVANAGFLPYPTYQGKRNQRPVPAAVTLEDNTVRFIEGHSRQMVGLLEGSGGVQKISWLVGGASGTKITATLIAPGIGRDSRQVTLKGGQN